MLYPSIDELLQMVDSKYSLVVAASRRARMLRDGAESQMVAPKSHKYVGVALEEIYGDIITVENQWQKMTERELKDESSSGVSKSSVI